MFNIFLFNVVQLVLRKELLHVIFVNYCTILVLNIVMPKVNVVIFHCTWFIWASGLLH